MERIIDVLFKLYKTYRTWRIMRQVNALDL